MSGIVQVSLGFMLWKQVIQVKHRPHVHVRTWIICEWFQHVEVVFIPVYSIAMAMQQYLTTIRGPIWCLWDFHCNLQALIYLHGHFPRSISSSFWDISSYKHIAIACYTGIWNDNTIHIYKGCHPHVPKSLASNIQFSFPIFSQLILWNICIFTEPNFEGQCCEMHTAHFDVLYVQPITLITQTWIRYWSSAVWSWLQP